MKTPLRNLFHTMMTVLCEHWQRSLETMALRFARFDRLGYRCTPRLRDLADRRLFTSGPIDTHRDPRLQPSVTGRLQRPRILHGWDDLLRMAGPLPRGWVTASRLGQKLQAYP
jgi:TnpA family transposase